MLHELNQKARPWNEFSEYLPSKILMYAKKIHFVGSRYTCNPPPTDTDLDILLLYSPAHHWPVQMEIKKWADTMPDSAKYPEGNFLSYRKGEINLLITHQPNFFNDFVEAANLCKTLNVKDKADRIKIHDILLEKYKLLENKMAVVKPKIKKIVVEDIAENIFDNFNQNQL